MRLYDIYIPPGYVGTDDPGALGTAVILREGFKWLAFFFSVIWALANGLWLTALAMMAALVVLVGVPEMLGLDVFSRVFLLLGFAIFCGASGNDFRRWGLQIRGFVCVAVVAARSRQHALLRFAEGREIEAAQRPSAHAPMPQLDLGPNPGLWS